MIREDLSLIFHIYSLNLENHKNALSLSLLVSAFLLFFFQGTPPSGSSIKHLPKDSCEGTLQIWPAASGALIYGGYPRGPDPSGKPFEQAVSSGRWKERNDWRVWQSECDLGGWRWRQPVTRKADSPRPAGHLQGMGTPHPPRPEELGSGSPRGWGWTWILPPQPVGKGPASLPPWLGLLVPFTPKPATLPRLLTWTTVS